MLFNSVREGIVNGIVRIEFVITVVVNRSEYDILDNSFAKVCIYIHLKRNDI